MRMGIGPFRQSRAAVFAFAVTATVVLHTEPGRSAEFGADPYIKGVTDIYAGILPTVPGLDFRTDAYHYEGFAARTIFNGFVQLGVEQDLTATIMTLTYVTPWKLLSGTYAFGVAPAMMAVDVNVGIGLPAFTGRVSSGGDA